MYRESRQFVLIVIFTSFFIKSNSLFYGRKFKILNPPSHLLCEITSLYDLVIIDIYGLSDDNAKAEAVALLVLNDKKGQPFKWLMKSG